MTTLDQAIASPSPSTDWRQLLKDYYELSKPGIGFYSLITTFAAFWVASPEIVNYTLLIHTILATAFVTCGGGTLNQTLEVAQDKLMRRTENRPLPSGRVSVRAAMAFGIVTSVIGVVYLQLAAGWLAATLALATLLGYLFVYTPLKKKTHLSTIVGAFPGAIPILIGWVAARQVIDLGGWTLFLILFFWQIPHFLAIAWMYRKDYARAGFPMLSVLDEEGLSVAYQATLYVVALVPISLLPTPLGLTGWIYFWGALLIGLLFIASTIYVAVKRTNTSAKKLLFASIVYLPVLLALMVLDKQ